MKFTLSMSLDNAAMQDGAAIADVLDRVAEFLRETRITSGTIAGSSLRDDNGNKIGTWSID